MTSREEISNLFDNGVEGEWNYLLMVVDTFDHVDYPVYCFASEYDRIFAQSSQNMQRVMEVYDLSKDRDSQLVEHRAFNGPKKNEK